MSKIGDKIRMMKYRVRHGISIENVILVVAVLMCLVWTYQSIMAMSRNWELSERLIAAKKELELVSVEVEAAELENDYYRTDEYQELLARKFLDKQMAGEKMVILSENSEEAKNKHKKSETEVPEKTYSNFEKWMNFLFPMI